jgi:hypothetical protein
MSHHRKTEYRAAGVLIGALLILTLLLASLALLAVDALAQTSTCPDRLRISASLGGCDSVFVGWTYTGQSPVVSQTLAYGDGFSPVIPVSARSYSRTGVGCSYSTCVTITQTYGNGTSCVASYHDNHNRPCDQCGGVIGSIGIANAASWRDGQTEDSIAVLGSDADLITGSAQAITVPLPLSLLGLSAEIAGRPAGLFFVSPRQINFYIPPGIPQGIQSVSVTTPDGRRFRGTANIQPEAPGIFTESANGQGYAVATWLPGYLVLWGTAFNSPYATLYTGDGRRIDATYSGQAPGLVGLWQLNFPMARPSTVLGAFVRSWVTSCRCVEGGYRDSQGFDLR